MNEQYHAPAFRAYRTAFLCVALVLGFAVSARAFSLAGPFAPWMTTNLSYGVSGELGGPMNLGEEYRWNMPIMTYGFDKSFLNYFGAEGVQAVEDAIAILNRLPPASKVCLDDYLTNGAVRLNYSAADSNLIDLKSMTLCLLVQRMGLAPATRNAFVLREWDSAFFNDHPYWLTWTSMPRDVFERFIAMRNYDPVTREPTSWINGTLFDFQIEAMGQTFDLPVDAVESPLNSWSWEWIGAAEWEWATIRHQFEPGSYLLNLTRDDVGGIMYLLNRNNLNVEMMDNSVMPLYSTQPTARNGKIAISGPTAPWPRRALRPGVEKITFRRHRTDAAGRFLPIHWIFPDKYVENAAIKTVTVRRLVTQPDILFSAEDFGCHVAQYSGKLYVYALPYKQNAIPWENCSALNGNPDGAGPGVIKPQARITFQKLGKYVAAAGGTGRNQSAPMLLNWARVNGGYQPAVIPGNQPDLTSLIVDHQTVTNSDVVFNNWTILGWEGRSYRMDTSRDKVHWTVAGSVVNTNGVFTFSSPITNGRYLRAVLQRN